ncbi:MULTISPECIES: hypothetical protein [Anaerococcus]|uniref:hypothetical protein n=1 Tax=Anaerococcus TaxID=165779 RepID=UPI0008A5C294|nr:MULTISPECIES: hypothetical protein [Anaerococcus]MDU5252066.1 hypothetical protein [Anaerococcus vaginalis]MDU6781717.1 hypothetical protein [Anaerococcus vaginalis]OFJ67402.1 hypothetical protein HMPREF2852_02425 [Anaerococcus sp. HMSC065G05]
MTKKQGKLAVYIGQIITNSLLVLYLGMILANMKSFSDIYESIENGAGNIEDFLSQMEFAIFEYLGKFKNIIQYIGFIKFLFFVNLVLLIAGIFIFKEQIKKYIFSAAGTLVLLISFITISPLMEFVKVVKANIMAINFSNPDLGAIEGSFANISQALQNLANDFDPQKAKFAKFLVILAIILFVVSIVSFALAIKNKEYDNLSDLNTDAKNNPNNSLENDKQNQTKPSEELKEEVKCEKTNENIKEEENKSKKEKISEKSDLAKDTKEKENKNKSTKDKKNQEKDKNTKSKNDDIIIKRGAYDFSSGFKKNNIEE